MAKSTLFTLALFLESAASAHDQAGSLGATASATDYYRINCTDDGVGAPRSLAVQIRDSAPSDAIKVSLQVQMSNQLVNTTDLVDSDLLYSPLVALNGGTATYHNLCRF